MMYYQHFNLTRVPFEKDIPGRDLFSFSQYQNMNLRCELLFRNGGFGLILGDAGTGKSTSLRFLTRNLNQNLYTTLVIEHSAIQVFDFYRQLCWGLGLIPSNSKARMVRSIKASLRKLYQEKHLPTIMIIDDVQFLGRDILNELQLLSSFDHDSKNYLAVLLSGLTHFKALLGLKTNEAFDQRISFRFILKPLSRDEMKEYIFHRLKVAGGHSHILSPDSLEVIFQFTHGTPRQVNNLITEALIITAEKKMKAIDPEIVEQAFSNIQGN